MEIYSHFLEDDDVGRLHVVTFAPVHALPDERATIFNSFNGRVTTVDGFALPYEYARISRLTTDFIERPGTGSSSLPESAELRRSYRKYGFVAIKDALVELQMKQEPEVATAAKLHSGGFSLGGHAAAMYLDAVDRLAASATLVDPAGLCRVNRAVGSGRFFGYAALEIVANACKLKPSVASLFEDETDIQGAYQAFIEASGLSEPPVLSKEAKRMELKEVTLPTRGEALRALGRVLSRAAEDERDFELTAQLSPMRYLTDHRSIAATNALLDNFDTEYPDQQTVRYGFMQHGDMHWWHDLAVAPAIVGRLLMTPFADLAKRLSYFK